MVHAGWLITRVPRFTTALLRLPPRQRAAFVTRDVLDFDAAQTASMLGCSVPAANSLLQRAYTRLRRLAPALDDLRRRTGSEHDDLVSAYVDAHHRGDFDAVLELVAADVRISMPPEAPCIGAYDAQRFFTHLFSADGPGVWHLVPIRANGTPATANNLCPANDTGPRA